jgi:hypothetical protein
MSNAPRPEKRTDPEGEERTWIVRPFEERDQDGLLGLYKEVFGRERSVEEFRWKLIGQESPVDTVWVAVDGDQVVGQHAGIPMRLKLGNREVEAMHAVEAMTHGAYRKQGMLTILGGGLYGHWRDSGIPIIMGLPHPGWGTRAYALGYRPAFPLVWLSRPLRPLDLLLSKLGKKDRRGQRRATIAGERRVGDVLVVPQATAGSEFDTLWGEVGRYYQNSVVRNAAWVQWRYLDPPNGRFTVLMALRNGSPAGYISYRLALLGGRPIGRVADVFSAPEDRNTIRALVSSALKDLRAQGAESAAILVAEGSHLHRVVRSHGFLLNRGSYDASFIPFADDLDAESLNDPARWLLTGGDFDVV